MFLAVCGGKHGERNVIVGLDPDLERRSRSLLAPLARSRGYEVRHERHHADAVLLTQSLQHIVRNVAGHVADDAGGGVREHDRNLADRQSVAHRVGRDVAEVDQHADAVHLAHHLDAKSGQTAQHGLVGGRVGPRDVVVVGQCQVAHTEHVQHSQRRQRAADRVPALGPHE